MLTALLFIDALLLHVTYGLFVFHCFLPALYPVIYGSVRHNLPWLTDLLFLSPIDLLLGRQVLFSIYVFALPSSSSYRLSHLILGPAYGLALFVGLNFFPTSSMTSHFVWASSFFIQVWGILFSCT